MQNMTTTIDFDTFELDVNITKIPEQKGGYDEPSYPSYYEIGDIFYKGVEITDILEEFCPHYLEIIQEQLEE